MSDYKLVPFEPTPEMVEAAEDAYMPFGDMDLALRMAILAAPPTRDMRVSVEYKLAPVKLTDEMVEASGCEGNFKVSPHEQAQEMWDAMLAAAPAVQGEPVAFCEDAALSIAERTFSTDVDEQLASDIIQYAQRLHSLYAAPQPTEQQHAPDVAALVEALEPLMKGYASLLEGGIDRITHLDGDCDLILDMLQDAQTALAVYRKGGE